MARSFPPVRPYRQFPAVNPKTFDPRESIFIPDLSVDDAKIEEMSPRKLRGIGIKVYLAAAAQEITAGAAGEDITFDGIVFNEGFAPPGATFTTVTIPYAGVYDLQAAIQWESDSNGNYRKVFFEVNGTEVEGDLRVPINSTRCTLSATRRLSAGDTVGLHVEHDSTTDPLEMTNGEDNCSLTVIFQFPI